MKFGSRSKAGATSQAVASKPDGSPASSTSSFISVGVLMEQRERPERLTVEELRDLDAISLESLEKEASPDELFDAYQGMSVCLAVPYVSWVV
jgi:hypothetical protein